MPTATPWPDGCVNLIFNGGWEDDGSWRYGTTPFSVRVIPSPVHSGERALRQGIPDGAANLAAHSSTLQEVTIPVGVETEELRYWVMPGGDGDGVDFREVRLLTSSYENLAQTHRDVASGNDQYRLTRILLACAGTLAPYEIRLHKMPFRVGQAA